MELFKTYQSKSLRSYKSRREQFVLSIDKIQGGGGALGTILSASANKTNDILTAPSVSLFSFDMNILYFRHENEKMHIFFTSEKMTSVAKELAMS